MVNIKINSYQSLIKLNYLYRFSKKYSNVKFNGKLSRVIQCGGTDVQTNIKYEKKKTESVSVTNTNSNKTAALAPLLENWESGILRRRPRNSEFYELVAS